MVDTPISGALVYAQYAWETTFGVQAGTINKAFGHDVSITVNPKNNTFQTRGLGSRDVQDMVSGQYEGTMSISFTLASTYFLNSVLGQGTDGAGSGPYTHYYTPKNVLPSMTVEVGYDMGTTDVVRKFLGVKVNSCTISAAVGEVVKVSLDCTYKDQATLSTTLDTTPDTETEEPMIFSQGDLEFPNATDIARVQSVELTIDNGLIPVYSLGQRQPTSILEGPRSYSGRVTHTFENSSAFLTYVGTGGEINTSEGADIELTFDNGLSTTSQRQLLIRLSTVRIDTDDIAANPNELVNEDVTFIAQSLGTAVAIDNTAGSWTTS